MLGVTTRAPKVETPANRKPEKVMSTLVKASTALPEAAPVAVWMPQTLPRLLPTLDACMFTVTSHLNGNAVHTLADSGASTSFMLEWVANKLKLKITKCNQWSGEQKVLLLWEVYTLWQRQQRMVLLFCAARNLSTHPPSIWIRKTICSIGCRLSVLLRLYRGLQEETNRF